MSRNTNFKLENFLGELNIYYNNMLFARFNVNTLDSVLSPDNKPRIEKNEYYAYIEVETFFLKDEQRALFNFLNEDFKQVLEDYVKNANDPRYKMFLEDFKTKKVGEKFDYFKIFFHALDPIGEPRQKSYIEIHGYELNYIKGMAYEDFEQLKDKLLSYTDKVIKESNQMMEQEENNIMRRLTSQKSNKTGTQTRNTVQSSAGDYNDTNLGGRDVSAERPLNNQTQVGQNITPSNEEIMERLTQKNDRFNSEDGRLILKRLKEDKIVKEDLARSVEILKRVQKNFQGREEELDEVLQDCVKTYLMILTMQSLKANPRLIYGLSEEDLEEIKSVNLEDFDEYIELVKYLDESLAVLSITEKDDVVAMLSCLKLNIDNMDQAEKERIIKQEMDDFKEFPDIKSLINEENKDYTGR